MFLRFIANPLRRPLPLLIAGVLGAYVLWVLSLPAWPSQDGPVHLYYTRVMAELVSGAPSAYRPYFFIKHFLPPYAVYYYALLLFSHMVSLLTADRVVVCVYLVSLVFGFRYAAKAIGPNADRMTLLTSVLLLNWALGMGFTNYCLAFSFALWGVGLWLRLGNAPALGKRFAFVALMFWITLTHPVPLLLVLGFGAVDLLCRYAAGRRSWGPVERRGRVYGWLTLAGGSVSLLYVKAFTVAHPLAQRTVVHGTLPEQIVRRLKDIATVKNLELLYGRWWEIRVYRGCLLLIAGTALVLAILQFRRRRAAGPWTSEPWTAGPWTPRLWTSGDSMLVFCACLLALLPMLPSDLSGAYYFTERLTILLWLMLLLAACAWEPKVNSGSAPACGGFPKQLRMREDRSRWADAVAGVFAVCATVLILHTADCTLRPFAERDAQLAHTKLPLQGQLSMVLDGGKPREYTWAGPPWDPFYWETVTLLRANGGILVNAPWLDSPIIPLAPTAALPGSHLPPLLANSPYLLVGALNRSSLVRSAVLDRSGVALFSPNREHGGHTTAAFLGAGWSCSNTQGGIYRMCTRGALDDIAMLAH